MNSRRLAVADDRQGERKIDDVEKLEMQGVVDAVLAPIIIRITRFGRAVPPRPVLILKAVLLRSFSSTNTSWLFDNMLLTTANSIISLCSSAGG